RRSAVACHASVRRLRRAGPGRCRTGREDDLVLRRTDRGLNVPRVRDLPLPGARPGDDIRDQRIERVEPLSAPVELLEELVLSDRHADVVRRGRAEIGAILAGADDRLLVVVGPCSVHDVAATRDYAGRLSGLAARLKDDLRVAMRVYFEKPR